MAIKAWLYVDIYKLCIPVCFSSIANYSLRKWKSSLMQKQPDVTLTHLRVVVLYTGARSVISYLLKLQRRSLSVYRAGIVLMLCCSWYFQYIIFVLVLVSKTFLRQGPCSSCTWLYLKYGREVIVCRFRVAWDWELAFENLCFVLESPTLCQCADQHTLSNLLVTESTL